jgi:nucleolar protein 56
LESTIVITLVGIFALNSRGKVVEARFFSDNPGAAAEVLDRLRRGEVVNDLLQLLKELLQRDYNKISFEDKQLAASAEKELGLPCRVIEQSPMLVKFREKIGESSVDRGRFKDLEAFREYTHDVAVAMAERAVTKETRRRDLHAIQLIRTLDDFDRTLNLFSGRIREWYGLHFPELDKAIEKHETYIRLVSDLGLRVNYTFERLGSEGLTPDKAKMISEKAEKSMGFVADTTDLELLQTLSKQTLELYRFRDMAEGSLNSLMEEVAPNMTSIIGSLLSARLISMAGSLDRLAKMPSSTMQVIGAEKALFRSLKTGSRPPKHGIIFQHQYLHAAPRWQRGKIARALASKLTIAARVDAFDGEFIGDKLSDQLEKRIKEIRDRNVTPPQVRKRNERSRGTRA